MASTILQHDRASVLPSRPTDGQIFVDGESVRWVYNTSLELWERSGTADIISNATSTTSGYLSPQDKNILDRVPAIGGGFGLIVDPKLLLKSESNPDGVITGDILLLSESLDIECVDSQLNPVDCEIVTDCETNPPRIGTNGFSFKLSDKFLRTLVVDMPGPKGKTGRRGDIGGDGDPGDSPGPVGDTGADGVNVDILCEFTSVEYEDSTDVSNSAVVGLNLDGCKLNVTKSLLTTPVDSAANKIKADPLTRSVTYASDPETCGSVRLNDWSLIKPPGTVDELAADVVLLRLPNGSNDGSEPIMLDGSKLLSGFVSDVVAEYHRRLVALDTKWMKKASSFIESLDDKARGILSSLADELSRTEFGLPAVEYGVLFELCGTTPAGGGGGGGGDDFTCSVCAELSPSYNIQLSGFTGDVAGLNDTWTVVPTADNKCWYEVSTGVLDYVVRLRFYPSNTEVSVYSPTRDGV